jgi:hypothetical protein
VCGSVGMFVGCAALSVCPRSALGGTEPVADVGADRAAYRSPFLGWETRASVRSAPRRVFSADDARHAPIAPELVPVASHSEVRALPPHAFRGILLQHLYRYLSFTVALESIVVNRTVLGIANGSVGIELPREMRGDAYKIYTDEAYHALFCADLLSQIEDVTGTPARLARQPFFITRLDAILAETDPAMRPLIELLFVIVSETLISATLADQSAQSDMAGSVRDVIRDHAVDEGKHHAYFASLLRFLWPQLSKSERLLTGRVVPGLVAVFLDPDVASVRLDLAASGLSEQTIDEIVASCFEPGRLQAQRQGMARQTLQYFRDLGCFEQTEARDQLAGQRLGCAVNEARELSSTGVAAHGEEA